MKRAFILLSCLFLFYGCAEVSKCVDVKSALAKPAKASSNDLKKALGQDLRLGKVGIGAKLDLIRAEYGQPDDILVAGCTARMLYRQEKAKNINLWFSDGEHLSMWSN